MIADLESDERLGCIPFASGDRRETYEKTYPDDLETLRQDMPSVGGIYTNTRWSDNSMTRALVCPPSTCQIVRRDGSRRAGWGSTNSLT